MNRLGCVLTVLAVSSAQADTIFVDDDAPLGGDGLSWTTAYRFVQDALDNASNPIFGVTAIRVAGGTYLPDRDEAGTVVPGDRAATFELLSSVALAGGYAGLAAGPNGDPDERDVVLYETILSGDLLGDDGLNFANYAENSYHVVTASGTDETAVLDGVTITAGHANAPPLHARGAGLLSLDGDPTLLDCAFTLNLVTLGDLQTGYGGAGMYNTGCPVLVGCTFDTNRVVMGEECDQCGGAGMMNFNAGLSLMSCLFTDNTIFSARLCENSGGVGIFNISTGGVLTDCAFIGNDGFHELSNKVGGGGLRNNTSSILLDTCEFVANSITIGDTKKGIVGGGGAGVSNDDSDLTAIDCIFDGNLVNGPDETSFTGGGAAIFGRFSLYVLSGCTFSDNIVAGGHVNIVARGGAIRNMCGIVMDSDFTGNMALGGRGGAISGVEGTITRCAFVGNRAGQLGGAIVAGNAPSYVLNCVFQDNAQTTSLFGGGGIANSSGDITVFGCVFSGNTSVGPGGGVKTSNADSEFTNCLFIGNDSQEKGGGLRVINSSATVTNCTLAMNEGFSGSGMYLTPTGASAVTNCVVWGNVLGQDFIASPQVTVSYSDIERGYAGIGNIDIDPLFVDPDKGDFRLQPGSPCIDAGNNWGVAPDVVDLDSDDDTLELTPWDLDGNPRFADDPATADSGCGVPVVVDMGAYEYQGDPAPNPVYFADLNHDGLVGVADLVILSGCIGSDDPDCCIADLDLDGDVGMSDRLLAWASIMVEFSPAQ